MISTVSQPKTFGKFLQEVARAGNSPTLAGPAGVGEAVDSDGGFLVPATWANKMLDKVYETGEILRRCERLPPPEGNKTLAPFIAEGSRENGSRFGAMSVAWTGEGGIISDSKPLVGCQTRALHKLAGLLYVTSELIEDGGPLLAEYVYRVGALELAFAYECEVVRGRGCGGPLGLLYSPAKIVTNKILGQMSGTIWGENIVSMMSRLWGPSWRRAIWLVNPSAIEQLARLTAPSNYSASGSGYTDCGLLWNWDGNSASGGWPTLCGRPVIPAEHCSAVGEEGDVILTDLSQYVVTDKSREDWSIHLRFLYDEAAYRFVLRCDGAPLWASALTPCNGNTTLSPIVTLQTRS